MKKKKPIQKPLLQIYFEGLRGSQKGGFFFVTRKILTEMTAICSHAERFQIGFHDSPVENSPLKREKLFMVSMYAFIQQGNRMKQKFIVVLSLTKTYKEAKKKKKKQLHLTFIIFIYKKELSSGKITCYMKLANMLKPVITNDGCSILLMPYNTDCCTDCWLQTSSSILQILLDLASIQGTAPALDLIGYILLLLASPLIVPQYQAGVPPVCRLWAG